MVCVSVKNEYNQNHQILKLVSVLKILHWLGCIRLHSNFVCMHTHMHTLHTHTHTHTHTLTHTHAHTHTHTHTHTLTHTRIHKGVCVLHVYCGIVVLKSSIP